MQILLKCVFFPTIVLFLSSGHSNDVNSVALSVDGSKVVSGSDDSTVKIWSTETGQVLQALSGKSNRSQTYFSKKLLSLMLLLHVSVIRSY